MSIISELILGFPKNSIKKVADIGCGSGELIYELRNSCEYLVGVDIAKGLLEKARYKLNAQKTTTGKIEFIISQAEKLPFKNRAFHSAVYSEIIEHSRSVTDILNEANRILVNGGYILITIPVWWVETIITFFDKEFMKFSGHVKRFRLRELKYLLARHGFKVVKIRNYYFEWAFFYTISAIYSRRFRDIDRRGDRYGAALKKTYWDNIESVMKKIITRGQKIFPISIIFNLLNFIYPKSYILVCRKNHMVTVGP